MKLSIVMPVLDREHRLAEAIDRTLAVDYAREVELIVITGTAGTSVDDPRVRVVWLENPEPGTAVRAAADVADGDYLIVLDAALRYDPRDIPRLLTPVDAGHATVVFGSRAFGGHSANSFWHVMGNKAVTTTANVLFNCYLSDLQTGLKLVPVALYRSLDVRSRGAGWETEAAAKLLRRGIRPYEVRVSFHARPPGQAGRTMMWDGIRALGTLVRERAHRPPDRVA